MQAFSTKATDSGVFFEDEKVIQAELKSHDDTHRPQLLSLGLGQGTEAQRRGGAERNCLCDSVAKFN